MKLLSIKLLVLGIGALALSTPSFSQSPYIEGAANSYNRYSHDSGPVGRPLYDVAPGYNGAYGAYGGAIYDQATTDYPVGTYPNGVSRSGSASSIDSGAAFNENRGYPAAYGYDGYIGE
jgi:hypothetical protein